MVEKKKNQNDSINITDRMKPFHEKLKCLMLILEQKILML